MVTIVQHKATGSRYYLLGTGFGMSHSAKPHWFFGNNVSVEKEGQLALVAVCDSDGEIGWFESSDLRVVKINGQELTEKEVE